MGLGSMPENGEKGIEEIKNVLRDVWAKVNDIEKELRTDKVSTQEGASVDNAARTASDSGVVSKDEIDVDKLIRSKMLEQNPPPWWPTPFPPCTELLLALVKLKEADDQEGDWEKEIDQLFEEYFQWNLEPYEKRFPRGEKQIGNSLFDGALQDCLGVGRVFLSGARGRFAKAKGRAERLRRLFIADTMWLHYYERMGIFRILGVILDDYATRGKLAINVFPKDSGVPLILETMVRQTRMGVSSTVRDRETSYRRSLGWETEIGRKLGLSTEMNEAFRKLFDRFIETTLQYYRDKRLAVAIRGSTAEKTPPSVATLSTIGNTIEVLQKAFRPFEYGRNHENTLVGILWVIAALTIIKKLRTTLGIPDDFKEPHQFVPAAYDILVARRSITASEANRYTLHKDCAFTSRQLLLDLQVLPEIDEKNWLEPDHLLEKWLDEVEADIETYRSRVRTLTGQDLGVARVELAA